MLDDADHGPVPDRLDASGWFRVALRSALVSAQRVRAATPTNACYYERVHVGRCMSRADRRPPIEDCEA